MIRLLVTLVVILAAAPAFAQQLSLQIRDGLVTLDATSVPARQILAEWARVGGTRVVGGEKLAGAPLTLKLVDVPERQALDIILRSAAGFMAAPRAASALPGASQYDRILILATTSAPAPSPTPTRVGATSPGGVRRMPPRPPNLPQSPAEPAAVVNVVTDDDDDDADQEDANEPDTSDVGTGVAAPVFTFPAPPGTPGAFVPNPTPGSQPPVITLQPNADGQPTIYNFVPTVTGLPGGNPGQPTFGVVGAPTPGMVQQPVQAQPPPGQRPPPR